LSLFLSIPKPFLPKIKLTNQRNELIYKPTSNSPSPDTLYIKTKMAELKTTHPKRIKREKRNEKERKEKRKRREGDQP